MRKRFIHRGLLCEATDGDILGEATKSVSKTLDEATRIAAALVSNGSSTMAYHLGVPSLRNAVRHLCRFGDTDVFPRLPEIAFLLDRDADIIQELKQLDLDSYAPGSAFEALAPKSRYGFRIVHQISLTDNLLLLGAVIEIAPKIEAHRLSSKGTQAFSYRFSLDQKGGLFRTDRSYKDWLIAQLSLIQGDLKIRKVVLTDISDFYARVNFHRLENLLDEVAPNHGAARYIKKHIKVIRAKQSFGLPVGGSAARLLAELALIDTDKVLINEERLTTRFVDDFRLFLLGDEDPYGALALLAEQLAINEGLSLNAAKTSVYTRNKFIYRLKEQVTDVSDKAEGEALDALVADLYLEREPDEADLEKLKSMNLLGFLQDEVGKDAFDMGRIKVIFRALKIAKPKAAIPYLIRNFSELVVFAREMTLLMQELDQEYSKCFNGFADTVIAAILSPPASSVQLIRTWLLELFVRGTVPISMAQLKKLLPLSSALDQRQMDLIRGRVGDQHYFRKKKTAFSQLAPIGQTCFIWGASCLPKDEYKAWLSVVKSLYSAPLADLYIKWSQAEQKSLIQKLNYNTDEDSDL